MRMVLLMYDECRSEDEGVAWISRVNDHWGESAGRREAENAERECQNKVGRRCSCLGYPLRGSSREEDRQGVGDI